MRFGRVLLPVLGIAVILLIWFAATAVDLASPLLLPPPELVVSAFWQEAFKIGSIWKDLGSTLARALASFTIAASIGAPVGLMLGLAPSIYRSGSFVLEFFRSIPPVVFLPIFMLAFGLGEMTHLAIAIYGAALVVAVNAAYGVTNVGSTRRMVGKLYGLSPWQVVYKIALPEAAPQIAAGMRIALSLALVLTVVVEMMMGTAGGMGKRIHDNQYLLDTPALYVSIVSIGALGYGLNVCFVAIERKVLHWID